jgi:DNA replication ATP-dependent helicase Dna2
MSQLQHIHDYFIPRFEQILSEVNEPNQLNQVLSIYFFKLLEYMTEEEVINFSTSFSRISYLKSKFGFNGKETSVLHAYRQQCEGDIAIDLDEKYNHLGLAACKVLLYHVTQKETEEPDLSQIIIHKDTDHEKKYWRNRFGLIYQRDQLYYFIPEDSSEAEEYLINFEERVEYKHQIARFFSFGFDFLHVSLIHVNIIAKSGMVTCQSMVINPNFLVDVTAVAEVYKGQEILPQSYLLKKFLAVPNSIPITLGNIANQILDKLIQHPEVDLKELMKELFQQDATQFLRLKDDELQSIMGDVNFHFSNLKHVLFQQLPKLGIHVDNCYTEPSFLSNIFGVQGRLDVLYQSDDLRQNNIIELKSGSAFGANTYGIAKNHYVQTLLYDLMISSSFGYRASASNYILYSKLKDTPLRYAPTVRNQQLEALYVRNNLLYIEYVLQRIDENKYFQIFSGICDSANQIKDRFVNRDFTALNECIKNLDRGELLFFREHVAFIAREHSLAKTGKQSFSHEYGFANLWMQTETEKIDKFIVLSKLEIVDNRSSEREAIIKLRKTENSNKLSKFRQGDIVILYPWDDQKESALKNQLFKASIVEMSQDEVVLRLRNQQYNQRVFTRNEFWNIESDFLDSGYNKLFKNLFQWISIPKTVRELSLGLRKPKSSDSKMSLPSFQGVTEEQSELLEKVIRAQEYFLLWGPPGTGKTSVVIRELARYYFNQKKPILLLAYTNRAVDEICQAIVSIDETMSDSFIRIGSRYSCDPSFRKNMLSEISKSKTTRNDFLSALRSCHIFVSTVSSINGQKNLFDIIDFETIIVDEASQLLEPMILSLFGKARKLVLVGDHKQLPAVVQQSSIPVKYLEHKLKDQISFTGCHVSLFERLMKKCELESWNDNIGALTNQGRMHQDIMRFPSEVFYNGRLNVLEGISRLQKKVEQNSDLLSFLLSKRVVFINSETDLLNSDKTNRFEAELIYKLIDRCQKNSEFSQSQCGVITPYRAQIAVIDQLISGNWNEHGLTIDTVERYQGSAKDIIIFSMCTNDPYYFDRRMKMESAVNDKKFNVAITRARELLIIIGNEEILSRHDLYKSWIAQAHKLNLAVF